MESETEFYCDRCWLLNNIRVPLKLIITEITEWDAEFKRAVQDTVDDKTQEPIPTFDVVTGEGNVEWEPSFICPVCKSPAWMLNNKTWYNDEEDLLYIEKNELGYVRKREVTEVALPKIQRCPSD